MLIPLVPLGIVLVIISCFKSDFGDLERPRSPGGDLENAPCGDSVYHEDEIKTICLYVILTQEMQHYCPENRALHGHLNLFCSSDWLIRAPRT